MKIYVVAVGHRMPDWVNQAWDDYVRRMPAEFSIELKEIKPEARTTGKTRQQMMLAEAKRIDAAIPEKVWRIALDERGRDLSTVALRDQLQQWRDQSLDIALIIGGPDGLDPALKQRCQQQIRISSLTLPHPMVRVVLVEQLYRAWSMLSGHPYHRS
ncbi:23S rRNA (pseudouridine(1915)-N(3))-methyltransferase RlmH [Paenalcaligenes niemegkensis]|uniref:23S rRNA (pseudouridine(1915)-N(3))-methyltransferase RlmH n=1 Tax=Paenalcaligenes niemegkensis TaxID=2895469 RepID=UPI001EE9AA15|nr:23S rRNA (pseudouridine(1915)-N(3))-methyltransferase RlmH [Paenalcaligenes niemegkensis]MCQ9616836.1 23S rRNA (pseudouridine(1915)-N(3))-methyltransferase RlmH [Paenalcaligenes niemegkensis]